MSSFKELPVIVFDVNETLMDMEPLKKKVNALLKNEKAFNVWFFMLLHYSLVDNETNNYHDFTNIAQATLQMAANVFNVETDESSRKDALSTIKTLKAHSDVPTGLQKLKDAGFTLVTLTNSPPDTLKAQMDFAGLKTYFKDLLSIDAVKKYKPAPESYQYAAQQLGKPLEKMIMVAAHGWDIAGAAQAGMLTAFISRTGQSLYPLATKPTFEGRDLTDIVEQIIKKYV